ncbi:hypothetical protein ACQY0O_008361 [Thecaphora frezii]|nr:putative glycoside hydrolase family 2 sugar binding protein [Thecaphora frezii]
MLQRGSAMDKDSATIIDARSDHPRPRFVRTLLGSDEHPDERSSWASLNGDWDFAFDDEEDGEELSWHRLGLQQGRRITVPFAYQTQASGINDKSTHKTVWYSRPIPPDLLASLDPTGSPRRHILLHFGAVDYESWVWVDGHLVAHHTGGHVGFSVDISSAVEASVRAGKAATLVVKVRDAPHDLYQPRGKQYWKSDERGNSAPESIFYTPTTGIWQSVWLEAVPLIHISHVVTVPDIDAGTVRIDVELAGVRLDVDTLSLHVSSSLAGVKGQEAVAPVSGDTSTCSLVLNLRREGWQPPAHLRRSLFTKGILPPEVNRDAWDNGLALWSPEHPTLYELDIVLKDAESLSWDRIHTYVGMRKVSIDEGGRLCLNNRPYFQKLLLDQGYWPGSGLTAPNREAFEVDINMAKELGFNGVRKHQKVEDPRFLYDADRLGFLVWGEMANAYEYSARYAQRFVSEWTEVVRRDSSHPCIVTWVPINESWGVPALSTSMQQRAHLASLYHLTKALDPTRPVIDNDGWQHVQTDLVTIHDYRTATELQQSFSTPASALHPRVAGYPIFVAAPPAHLERFAVLCTEFGGLALGTASQSGWGYGEAALNPDAFLHRFKELVAALTRSGVVQGFCYTQLADVQQEVNGLLSADRRHKLDPKRVKEILDAVQPRLV